MPVTLTEMTKSNHVNYSNVKLLPKISGEVNTAQNIPKLTAHKLSLHVPITVKDL